ncbi:MAG: substrate-binding domain-containing protein [Nitrospirae bacterium]|nr:substrate-binding domain-containing protein [Nitrospirota bacterium]
MKRRSLKNILFIALILIPPLIDTVPASEKTITCASTTSTENSGFFKHILPMFEKETGINVRVIAVGTGAAIEIGKRGDADVVFVHAKELETKALIEGYFVNRYDVMYNDFVIIGPEHDPLGIKNAGSAQEAFRRIAMADYPFVSRADGSGTHLKELSIWKVSGIDPKGKWYLEVGQGMEKTQRIADEKSAYTLTDRGTWLATKDKLKMIIVFEGDPMLFNQYGVMVVNPKRYKNVKYKEAMLFINWLISEKGKKAILDFKDRHGNQLFIPNANVMQEK